MFAVKTRLFAVVIAVLFAAACSNPFIPKPTPIRTFKLGLIPGAQEFVDFVMEQHGMLNETGLKAEKVKSLSPNNLHLMVSERQVDIGFGGFTTMATARAEGKDVIVIGGVFSPVNMVFVRKNSPIQSLKDLKGKKLGVFGGPGSTTFTFLAVLAQKWGGIDLLNEVNLVSGAGPLLIEQLSRGAIDAALLGTTETIQMVAQDRFRTLIDLSEEYKAHQGGHAPAHVTIVTNEAYAKEHSDVVRDYLKAYQKTLEFIHAHPGVWDEYAASIMMDDPKERRLLEQKMEANLVEKWDDAQIAAQNEYLKLVHDTLGDTVLKSIPADLIRTNYTPK
jgi:NitT/TauT family transport system substrate-binding protein